MNATGAIFLDKKQVLKRYYELNKLNECELEELNFLSDDDIYCGLLVAFGTIVREMI